MAITANTSNRSFEGQDLKTFPVTVKNETVAEVTLLKGSLLVFDVSDGYYYAYAGGIEKPTAIVINDLTIGAATNTTAAVVVAGIINGSDLSLPGSYAIDDVPSSNAGTVMAITADAGNTGDGVPGAITQGSLAKAGTYTLTCKVATVDVVAASGTIVAGGANTGDGTASAVTGGTSTLDGDYELVCIDATVSGSEIFSVIDPNGVRLADLTVGVAYLNNHFGVTISDGTAQFIVGDTWTMTGVAAVAAVAGTFGVVDPENNALADLTVAVAYDNGHFGVTIADGATNFIVGDIFTVVGDVAAEGSIRVMLKERGLVCQDTIQMVS